MPVGLGVFSLTRGVPVLSSAAAGSRGKTTPGRFTGVPRKLGSGLTAWEHSREEGRWGEGGRGG